METSELLEMARREPGWPLGTPVTSAPPPVRPLTDRAAFEALCMYDFMKCQKCGRLCTKPEMERGLGRHGTGSVCPCGSMKYAPVNPPAWAFLLPRVLAFAGRRFWSGLRGWRTVRVRCQAEACSYVWQAVFRRGTDVATLECPRCHAHESAPVSAMSFADAPSERWA